MRNEPIVLFITDGECKECVAADANVRSLASTRGYGRVRVLTIDTRKQKWATRGHDVQTQPTIIGFHGFKETGRVVNQSDPSKILSVFSSTLR